ncbi:hypothetical protein [Sphingomonas bacterium]|uniref:hypothetical protein n=1 Tax=Sphingomonas bacterium TaxID=1895847 RepID=UPI0015770D51|nr:hypothetical protein [Sphingomonas bacterium]
MTKFLGGLFVAVGVLLAGTTGLCTGAVILFSLSGLVSDPVEMLSASPVLLVGIIPCGLGILLARAGFRMMRSPDE